MTGQKIKGGVWRSGTVTLLQNHQFQTSFCQDLLNKTKEENLKTITSLHERARKIMYTTCRITDLGGQHIIHPPAGNINRNTISAEWKPYSGTRRQIT